MLVITGKNSKKSGFTHTGLKTLGFNACIHERELKGKEKIDSYRETLKIEIDGDSIDPRLLDVLSKSEEMALLDSPWDKAMKSCNEFLGSKDVILHRYEGNEAFRIRAFQDEGVNRILLNPAQVDFLSEPIKTSLLAHALASLKLDHIRYHKYIRKIKILINVNIDKVVAFIEPTMKSSDDFLKAPLFFMIGLLKREKLRRSLLEKILTNIDSLRQYPGLTDVLKKIFNLLNFQEISVSDFAEGSQYSLDRIAYRICLDLGAATQAIIYGETPALKSADLSSQKIAESLHNPVIRNRVKELWKFALTAELNT